MGVQQLSDRFGYADDLVVRSSEFVDIFDLVTPDNWRLQQHKFLDGHKTLNFVYKFSDAQEQEAERFQDQLKEEKDQMEQFSPENEHESVIRDWYVDGLKDAIQNTRMLLHIGNEPVMRDASKQVWGTPSNAAITFAENIVNGTADILTETANGNEDKVEAAALKQDMQKLLDAFNLAEWRVTYTDNITHVMPGEKTVLISNGNDQGRIDASRERLLLHEFGVHVLRSANGWNQSLKLLGIGLHGYETTEEGLTSYLELMTGHMTEGLLTAYALRVLAIDSVLNEESFQSTFNRLEPHTTDEKAFYTAMRAHRGGGFIKDHIYLEGLHQVRNYMNDRGGIEDLHPLYAGKVPLDALDDVKELQDAGVLGPATHRLDEMLDQLLEP